MADLDDGQLATMLDRAAYLGPTGDGIAALVEEVRRRRGQAAWLASGAGEMLTAHRRTCGACCPLRLCDAAERLRNMLDVARG